MSDDGTEHQNAETAESNDTGNSQTAASAQAASTPVSTQSSQSQPVFPDFSALTDALNALPEKVANAVKEATPKPVHVQPRSTQQTNSDNGQQNQQPNKRTFAQRWFGQ